MTDSIPSIYETQMTEISGLLKSLPDGSFLKCYLGLVWIELFLKGIMKKKNINFEYTHELKVHFDKIPFSISTEADVSSINTAFDEINTLLEQGSIFPKPRRGSYLGNYPSLRYIQKVTPSRDFEPLNVQISSIAKPLKSVWSVIK